MDVFVEYLVKKKRTVRDNLITVSILLCVVLLHAVPWHSLQGFIT